MSRLILFNPTLRPREGAIQRNVQVHYVAQKKKRGDQYRSGCSGVNMCQRGKNAPISYLLSLVSNCTNICGFLFYLNEWLINPQCYYVFFADDHPLCTPTARDSYERLSLASQGLPPGFPSPFLFPDGLSSIETLLTNIQVSSTDW